MASAHTKMQTAKERKALLASLAPRARRVVAFIETHLCVPEGRDAGKPVVLRNWQIAEIQKIYGNPHGTRRAILSFGRKNGKTALAAMLLLVHLCGPEARPNGQLYSAARSREQAAVLFRLAGQMVRRSPAIAPEVVVVDSKKEMRCFQLGTVYRALSRDAPTALGLSPAFIVHDELGQVKGPRDPLYEALETATGAQSDPLSLVISTQAPTDADLLSVLIDDALKGTDPRVVVSLYTAPEDLDPFGEEAVRAANPAFGDFQNPVETMAMAEDARRMPARENEFRNLILNQRVDASTPFISRGLWRSCTMSGVWRGGQPSVADFGDAPVFGGLDLSEVNDLTCLVLKAPIGGVWHTRPFFWLPEEGIVERSRKDRVPYDVWASQGLIELCPGRSVSYDWVATRLVEILRPLNVQRVAFDRWNWRHFRPCLERAGAPASWLSEEDDALFARFGQGMVSMSPALRTLESRILDGDLAHTGHPVLTMCMANAVVTKDPSGNRKLDKAKAAGRIDGAVSLAMASGVSGEYRENAPSPSYLKSAPLMVL